MSVKKVEMFTVVCDNCEKENLVPSIYSDWQDKTIADTSKLEEENWFCNDDFNYCQDCYEYDDEDNLVVKTVLHKQRSL